MPAHHDPENLEPNRLPAEPIRKVVKRYLETQWDLTSVDDAGSGTSPLYMLALRCDVNEETLWSIIFQNRVQTIDFDLADLLFSKMNCVDLWWGELNDIYTACVLTERKKHQYAHVKTRLCAAHGCAVRFVPPTNRRIYCTPRCKSRAEYRRKRLKGRYGNIDKCPHGHEWSPENTRTDARTGKRYCRTCSRIDQANRRAAETPEKRAKRLAYSKAYAARKDAA